MNELHKVVAQALEEACAAEQQPPTVARRLIALLESYTREDLMADQKAERLGEIRELIVTNIPDKT